MSRIRRHNQELIISVASQLFATQGYAATKIVDIAKKADIPKANIFYYFNSKEALYLSVLNTITKPLLSASQSLESIDDPVEALNRYIITKLNISRDYPYASKVFANEVISGAKSLPVDIHQQLLGQSKMIVNKFKLWQQQGLMDDIDPQHLIFMIWAMTQTYADFSWQICSVMGKSELDEIDFERAAELIIKLVINGCNIKAMPTA
ncbi:TetR/AcrR family transcriptional regulator [Vibrio sp. SS-MA-C1-2]|uniref:TetR/AcrR family transcriptional regulator n=1 Tax=Vibrio sp. SS-MA-C1-2 TaxID=2908646 RepID=UPI001F24A52E|nr:TetR/AcrR family transcriptional regulator [Vibrio sp. SS-MA-C1-2]UJF19388.1 TetR/AcrR family transcriptional regulator [Vibrio sp. SS-MA-C1-2]